jgi:hypothetical protein
MKKIFNKIAVIALIIFIFPLISGFCLHDLTISHPVSNNSNLGACQSVNNNTLPTKQNNSILPCCAENGHAGTTANYQATESIGEPIFLTYFLAEQIPLIIASPTIYNNPIISPPKLLALKTTVLRL